MVNPIAALWRMFAFETHVELVSDARPTELLQRLSQLIAAPRSFRRFERRKPLRGRISPADGFVRWPINKYRFISPRSLHFQLTETSEGTVLTGSLKVWMAFRVIVVGWFCCDVVAQLVQIIFELWHHKGARTIWLHLLFILVGFCMAFGYTWVAVRVGRSRDRMLVKVLRHSLANATAADTVRDLPSQSGDQRVTS